MLGGFSLFLGLHGGVVGLIVGEWGCVESGFLWFVWGIFDGGLFYFLLKGGGVWVRGFCLYVWFTGIFV